jgi:hypothetical protein
MATTTTPRETEKVSDSIVSAIESPSLTERAANYFREAIRENPVVESVNAVRPPGREEIFVYVTTTEAYGPDVDKIYEAWVDTRQKHRGSRLDVVFIDPSDFSKSQ